MLLIITRSVIIFIILLVILRLMGKRQIAEMQPYELAITLIIADLACIPMTDTAIPLAYGIVSILAIFFIHQLLTVITSKSEKVNKFISGSPCLVMDKDGLKTDILAKVNMSVSDLLEKIRGGGYCGFEEVNYAIFETSGNCSFIGNETQSKDKSFSQILVSDGKPDVKTMARLDYDLSRIKSRMAEYGEKEIENIVVYTVNRDGRIYIQAKGKPKAILTEHESPKSAHTAKEED